MNTEKVTFQLPEELIQAIDSHARAIEEDRTSVVIQALKQKFGCLPCNLAPMEQLNEIPELKIRISELEEKVAVLTTQLAKLSQPELLDNTSIQRITALSEYFLSLMAQSTINVPQTEEITPQTISLQTPNNHVLSSQYIQLDNFLSQEERNRLLNYVWQHESDFVPTSTSTSDADYRRSLVFHSFPEFSELIIERLQTIIPFICNQFGVSPFVVSTIEAQLTAHNDGNYYKIHNDNGSLDTANREFTYVYYFYKEPKPFLGGELKIYDSEIKNNFYVASESFKTIEPRNNSIVFFLSRYMHEVLPITCQSKVFADSRFTINGWIRR